jgi:hypothetical protein
MAKDYSQYFDSFKVISEGDGKKRIRVQGKNVTVYSEPDYKLGKKRGKEEITVLQAEIPEEMQHIGRGKKYQLVTYGCQMNVHDSEHIAGLLESMGYEATESETEADVILYNTCAIRENAEDKVFGELGRLKRLKTENPELVIGVCGCMSQEESVVNKILKSYHQVDLIFGTHNIHRLPTLLRDALLAKDPAQRFATGIRNGNGLAQVAAGIVPEIDDQPVHPLILQGLDRSHEFVVGGRSKTVDLDVARPFIQHVLGIEGGDRYVVADGVPVPALPHAHDQILVLPVVDLSPAVGTGQDLEQFRVERHYRLLMIWRTRSVPPASRSSVVASTLSRSSGSVFEGRTLNHQSSYSTVRPSSRSC